jgi:hypothetical protein
MNMAMGVMAIGFALVAAKESATSPRMLAPVPLGNAALAGVSHARLPSIFPLATESRDLAMHMHTAVRVTDTIE